MLFGDNSGYVGALGRSTKVSFNWVVKRQERTKDELILWKEEVKKKKKGVYRDQLSPRPTSYISSSFSDFQVVSIVQYHGLLDRRS